MSNHTNPMYKDFYDTKEMEITSVIKRSIEYNVIPPKYSYQLFDVIQLVHMGAWGSWEGPLKWIDKGAEILKSRLENWYTSSSKDSYEDHVKSLCIIALEEYNTKKFW